MIFIQHDLHTRILCHLIQRANPTYGEKEFVVALFYEYLGGWFQQMEWSENWNGSVGHIWFDQFNGNKHSQEIEFPQNYRKQLHHKNNGLTIHLFTSENIFEPFCMFLPKK